MKYLLAIVALAVLALPNTAWAFCGFYVGGGDAALFNDATQVVLLRDKNTTVLSMQNKYKGPAENFAMVVPVPQILQKENVKTLEKTVFDQVDKLSAPRLVEYWEQDPCPKPMAELDGMIGFGGLGSRGTGRGGGGLGYGRGSGGFVEVRAEFAVGEYDIAILETNDAATLDSWLKSNKYKIPDGATPYFKPYIESGMYFFVAKVDAKKVKYEDGAAVLSPLRFHYQSDEFSLPIRLGMINSSGKQDLIVYVLSPNQRYEVANYPNVTIPTNIEVNPKIKTRFGEFYEALFDRTIEENPKAVVTEYSWGAQKCDPCPSGVFGGRGLRPQDIKTLGNDIINHPTNWGGSGWVLTRLHARYAKDGVGQDLVFKKADAIVGGRESRAEDGSLEKGSAPGTTNNFQGRYIIRNEWEGDVKCENPQRGMWGGPPNAYEMNLTAEAIVTEFRRAKAAEQGREPTDEELEAPRSDEERRAVAFQLRRKFGTSEAPASRSGGTISAPSANTRGAAASLGGGGIALGTLIRESIPELKLEPTAEPAAIETPEGEAEGPQLKPASDGLGERPVKQREPPKGCSSVPASPAPALPLLLLGLVCLGRRRSR